METKKLIRITRHFLIKFNMAAYGRAWKGRKTKVKWNRESTLWHGAFCRAFNLLMSEIGYTEAKKAISCIK